MSSSDYSIDSDDDEVRNINEEAQSITKQLIAKKSSAVYQNCFDNFKKWQLQNNITDITENVLLVYFNELSKTLKPSTLWSRWSMLKTLLNLNFSIDINTFIKLKTFLKNNSKGFKPKKSKVFSWLQIQKFLDEAPDIIYLAVKVVLIFGFCGAMRSGEYSGILTTDVEDSGSHFKVNVRDTKNYYPRNFVIEDPYCNTVRQYIALRPDDSGLNKFFLNYYKGTCKRQPIGKNTIADMPRMIAEFLSLPEASKYTGHCFRRTSTTLLANGGATLTDIKRHGGWKSSTVAESYIENSTRNKTKIFQKIVNSENLRPTNTNHSKEITKGENSGTSTSKPSMSINQKFSFKENLNQKTTITTKKIPIKNGSEKNSTQSVSQIPIKLQNESEPEPLITDDYLANFDDLEFENVFSPIPTANPNYNTTSCSKRSTSSSKTSTNSLDELNMISPVIKIKKCKIMNVTINYSK